MKNDMILKPKIAGEFKHFKSWRNNEPAYINKDAICVDQKGRRCLTGKDFKRAHDEDAFPVVYFWEFEEVSA